MKKVNLNDIIFGAALMFFGFTLGKYTERRKQDKVRENYIRYDIKKDSDKK